MEISSVLASNYTSTHPERKDDRRIASRRSFLRAEIPMKTSMSAGIKANSAANFKAIATFLVNGRWEDNTLNFTVTVRVPSAPPKNSRKKMKKVLALRIINFIQMYIFRMHNFWNSWKFLVLLVFIVASVLIASGQDNHEWNYIVDGALETDDVRQPIITRRIRQSIRSDISRRRAAAFFWG